MRVANWLRVAVEPPVVKRSATVCVLVGTISPTLLLQVVLTYLVPFMVSTATSVAALRPTDPRRETLLEGD
jgi:hypothetical protein